MVQLTDRTAGCFVQCELLCLCFPIFEFAQVNKVILTLRVRDDLDRFAFDYPQRGAQALVPVAHL